MTPDQLRERFASHRLTNDEIELCASKTCADHPEWPAGGGYLDFDRIDRHREMAKTHKQLLCGECLLWKIWVPKSAPRRGDATPHAAGGDVTGPTTEETRDAR